MHFLVANISRYRPNVGSGNAKAPNPVCHVKGFPKRWVIHLDEFALTNRMAPETLIDLERTGQTLSALGFAYAISGKPSKAITLVKELEQRYSSHKALGREIAAVYAGLGNYDKTFSWLEADLKSRSTELSTIRYLPPFRSMRNTPQFQDLLSRMGLSSKLD
jgi:hypothetical protein